MIYFQWFCVRLAKIVNTETGNVEGYTFIGPVLPLTGWNSKYIWIGKRK